MNITKLFPELNPEDRDREYKRYSEQLRDKVIYEFLFNGRSNRWSDENILLEDKEYSRGWFSMGILHHLGLREPHKGFFKDVSIEDAINYLTKQGKVEYGAFIAALKRYAAGTYDLYNENSLEKFAVNDKFGKLHKQVGKSKYTDGVRIDKEFHEIFNPTDSKVYTPRGKTREINIFLKIGNQDMDDSDGEIGALAEKCLKIWQEIAAHGNRELKGKNVSKETGGKLLV